MKMPLFARAKITQALLLLCFILGLSGTASAAVISNGTPTTSVPTHLSDGSYLFPPGITVTLSSNQFLLPVEISGATNLQSWQFDLLFAETVVTQVDPDPFGIDHGIYGAEFVAGDPNTLSTVLAGFVFSGLVDDVAGSYPLLNTGPSGDGVLAYVLFQFLPGQETNNPNFSIANESVFQQVPEPSTRALLAALTLLLPLTRRRAARA